MPTQSPVRSPCIGICQLDEHQHCIACHRSTDEIASWSQLDDHQKRLLLSQLKQRRARPD